MNELPLSSRCELVYYWVRGFILFSQIKYPEIQTLRAFRDQRL
jgi:hypothetical protein